MKKTNFRLLAVLTAGVIIVSASPAFAQDKKEDKPAAKPEAPAKPDAGANAAAGGQRRRQAPDRMKTLTEGLTLTDAQQAKLKPILDEERKKLSDLRADTAVSDEDRRTKSRAIRDDSNKKIKELLTPEQQEKFAKLQEQQRGNRRPPAAQ